MDALFVDVTVEAIGETGGSESVTSEQIVDGPILPHSFVLDNSGGAGERRRRAGQQRSRRLTAPTTDHPSVDLLSSILPVG